jgi:D-serine deaminase-like pyridoxal phosphate-dependent protein
MKEQYRIENASDVVSPALVFFKDLIRGNIRRAVQIAGNPGRLRPHVKTHKTREIVRLEMEAGIMKHKCATLAEAEMLAGCGVREVLIAYNLVGPNCSRLAQLVQAFSECRFAVTVDHEAVLSDLSNTLAKHGREVEVMLDIDVGQQRTGIGPGAAAVSLYGRFNRLPGVRPGGLHVYDGHNHQESFLERRGAVAKQMAPVLELRSELERNGLLVPRLVVGGTPTFPIYAEMEVPGLECAPGTCFLHDYGYGTRYTDIIGFIPAALLLTRVISRPTSNRITMDLGYKAVASDPPAGQRCFLLNVPDYKAVLHNEEHLVVETSAADRFAPGDEIYAIPTHICPTCAMHKEAYVVENGQITERWQIVARDRVLNY